MWLELEIVVAGFLPSLNEDYPKLALILFQFKNKTQGTRSSEL